jgi:PAS domain S-box-containing protein
MPTRRRSDAVTRRAIRALHEARGAGASVVVLGFDHVGDDSWAVLAAAGVSILPACDVPAALDALTTHSAQVVIADTEHGGALVGALRRDTRLAAVHVVLGAALESPAQLRAALDVGADDVMRFPFQPEVLAARVAAGLRAARLRAGEVMLRSLVANIPGVVYRCACDADWTMEWLSDDIEELCGYPASDFIAGRVRTFTSVIHPDDRELVERSVQYGVRAGQPYTIEYRIVHRSGDVRWVLERGQAADAGDGRWWLDGAIFDITARKMAEEALREREIVETQLAEVRASAARILEAADRARREIERNLHDGAQQRFVSIALQLQLWLAAHRDLPEDAQSGVAGVLGELRAGLAELRDLAHGLHPAVLTDRGLKEAVLTLAHRAAVPVELDIELDGDRAPLAIESVAYFTVAEALTNVAKYAEASYAWVCLRHRGDGLHVEIGDDGIGGLDDRRGSGVQGLRDRIGAVGGTLQITSPPNRGTVVRASLPIEPAETQSPRFEHAAAGTPPRTGQTGTTHARTRRAGSPQE